MISARRQYIRKWAWGIAVLAVFAVCLSLGVGTAQAQKTREKPPAPPPREAAIKEDPKSPGETKPALDEATRKLFTAVELNDMPAVKSSIEAGADMFAQNADAMTAADLAVDEGNFIIAHYLLSRRMLGATPPVALVPGKADKAMAAIEAKPKHKLPKPPVKPRIKPLAPTASEEETTALSELPKEPVDEPQAIAEAPPAPSVEPPAGDADKPLAKEGFSEFFKSLVELVTPGGEKPPEAKKQQEDAVAETVVDPDLLADGLGEPGPDKDGTAPAGQSIVETVVEDPDEVVFDVTKDDGMDKAGDGPIVELIEESPTQLEETGLETLTADSDFGLDKPAKKTAKKTRPEPEKEEEGFLGKLAGMFSSDKKADKPEKLVEKKVAGPTPEEVAAYDLPLPAPRPQAPNKFSPRFMDRLADFLEDGKEEEFKAWLPKMQVMNGGVSQDKTAKEGPPVPKKAPKAVVERLPLPDQLKQETAEGEPEKAAPEKITADEPQPEKGLFRGAFDKLVDVLTPDFGSKDREQRVTLEPEEKLAKADTGPDEEKAEEAPGFWPVTEVETAEAPLVMVNKPVNILFDGKALKGVTLSLGQSVSLENSFPPGGDGIDPFNRCVKKNRGTTLFCLETLDWPENLKSDFLVPTILYTGQKAIARYDQGIASRFHALFPSESFKRVAAYFDRRFGPPTDVWNRSIAPFAKPRQDNPTLAWRSIDLKTGAVTVLEIRQYDDSRGGFPDTKRGTVMLYLANTPSIFPQVSPHELMSLSRTRLSPPSAQPAAPAEGEPTPPEAAGAGPKIDEDSFALPPDPEGR